jgi:hypothetical protein
MLKKQNKFVMIVIGIPLWSFMLFWGLVLLLVVIDAFLAMDVWPWTECRWITDDVLLNYPVERYTSAVQVTPQPLLDWLEGLLSMS